MVAALLLNPKFVIDKGVSIRLKMNSEKELVFNGGAYERKKKFNKKNKKQQRTSFFMDHLKWNVCCKWLSMCFGLTIFIRST